MCASLGISRATPLSLSYNDIVGVWSSCAWNRLTNSSTASFITVMSGCCENYDIQDQLHKCICISCYCRYSVSGNLTCKVSDTRYWFSSLLIAIYGPLLLKPKPATPWITNTWEQAFNKPAVSGLAPSLSLNLGPLAPYFSCPCVCTHVHTV